MRHFLFVFVFSCRLPSQWVKLDVKGQVREGYPFTVACKANGSKNVKLYWYKDGSPVDPSHALLRNVSVEMDPQQDLRGFFILYLNVKQASLADRGEYECRANDWGQAARKSVFLDVLTPPILDLVPANPAVQVVGYSRHDERLSLEFTDSSPAFFLVCPL